MDLKTCVEQLMQKVAEKQYMKKKKHTKHDEEEVDMNVKNLNQKNIGLQKIQAKKQEILDFDFILNQYNNSRSQKLKNKKKDLKKDESKVSKKEDCLNEGRHDLENKRSSDLVEKLLIEFEKFLQEKKLDYETQLQIFREKMMKNLFIELGFEFQKVIQKSTMKQKLIGFQQKLLLLKTRVCDIDSKLVEVLNKGKQASVSLRLESQWKWINQKVRSQQNVKLRQGILGGKITPDMLVSSNQIILLQFLPQQKQKQLRSQTEMILKLSEIEEKETVLFDSQKEQQHPENNSLQKREKTIKCFKQTKKESKLISQGTKIKEEPKKKLCSSDLKYKEKPQSPQSQKKAQKNTESPKRAPNQMKAKNTNRKIKLNEDIIVINSFSQQQEQEK